MGMNHEYKGLYAKPCDDDCKECRGTNEVLYFYHGKYVAQPCPFFEQRADEEFRKAMNIH